MTSNTTTFGLNSPTALPFSSRLAYGFATLGTGSFLVVPQLFLLFFMTDQLGISPFWASLTLLAPKLWEFLTDPYIGLRSDQLKSRWGRRHPFMLFGGVLLSVGIAMVFNVPTLDTPQARWLYVTSMFVLATTGYALFIVPYTALLGEITTDAHERTRVVALRMGFLSLSLLVAAVVWPEVLKSLGAGLSAYAVVGWGVGVLCLIAILVTVAGTRNIPIANAGTAEEAPLLSQLRTVASNKAFVMLATAYGLQMLAQSANSAMLAYAGKYLSPLGANFLPLYFGATTLVSILAMIGWSFAATRFSKRFCFIAGSAIGSVGYVLSTIGLTGSVTTLVAGAVLCGIGFSAGQVFGFSLLPDILDQHRRRNFSSHDGAFTGVWVGLEKLGLALGATVAGLVIGWFGFIASTGETVAQPAAALGAMTWLFGYVPAVLMIVAMLPLTSSAFRELERPGS
ncbi:MAG: MFS transporter [Ottowia sp.]|uniref:MFS transporter n=1 Tax=Ottowia sp. TaxID=1898956 RepID=UPI003C7794C4